MSNKPDSKHVPLLMLLVQLMLSLTACASKPPASVLPSVPPPAIPSLAPESRQPSIQELPSICSQGCSAGLTTWRENSLKQLTEAGLPASAASAPTMR